MCSCCGQTIPRNFGNPSRSSTTVALSINDLHFGADVEVPNADPEAVSPLIMPVGDMKPLIIIFILFVSLYFEETQYGNPDFVSVLFWMIYDDLLEVR